MPVRLGGYPESGRTPGREPSPPAQKCNRAEGPKVLKRGVVTLARLHVRVYVAISAEKANNRRRKAMASSPYRSMGVEIAKKHMELSGMIFKPVEHAAKLPQPGTFECVVQMRRIDRKLAISSTLIFAVSMLRPWSSATAEGSDWHP